MHDGGNEVDDLAIIAALFDSMRTGNRDAVLGLIHEEAVWRPSQWSGGGVRYGRREVGEWMDQFGPSFENLSVEVASIQELGSRIIVLATLRDHREDPQFEVQLGWSFAVRDRRMIDGRAYMSWEETLACGGEDEADVQEPESAAG